MQSQILLQLKRQISFTSHNYVSITFAYEELNTISTVFHHTTTINEKRLLKK